MSQPLGIVAGLISIDPHVGLQQQPTTLARRTCGASHHVAVVVSGHDA